jgi:hypothetical protein
MGALLVGVGMFILCENVAGALAGLRDLLGVHGSGSVGAVPAFILAVSQALRINARRHEGIFHVLMQHLLVISWPLVLVKMGTALTSKKVLAGAATELQNKFPASVDPRGSRSTSE